MLMYKYVKSYLLERSSSENCVLCKVHVSILICYRDIHGIGYPTDPRLPPLVAPRAPMRAALRALTIVVKLGIPSVVLYGEFLPVNYASSWFLH